MNAAYKYDILGNHNDYDKPISGNASDKLRNDPFDLGIGLGNTVKGLANMNHEQNLSAYAEELVSHYAKYDCEQYELSLSDIPDDDQNELVRLFMESTDRETTECVHGNDFSIENDYTCALLSMLNDNCQETREHFAEVTRKNIIIYYAESLQTVLDDACNSYLCDRNNEAGFYSHQDQESGDIHWGRF